MIKKLIMMLAAVTAVVRLSGQTVEEGRSFDQLYIGVNGGFAAKTTSHGWFEGVNPNVGLRLGRYFTPVFGLAVESNIYFSNKPQPSVGTFVRTMNTSLLATINLTHWASDYRKEPRLIEFSATGGIGWGHVFGHPSDQYNDNTLTSKAGIDMAVNLGKKKAWQVYIEPAFIWTLAGSELRPDNDVQYDANELGFQVNVGVIYKFKNSNGTHNFKLAELRDQSEIDILNAKINDLHFFLKERDAQIADKDRQIEELKKALEERETRSNE